MAKDKNKYIDWMKNHKIISIILGIFLFSMFINLITPNATEEQKEQWAQERLIEQQKQEAINQQSIVEEEKPVEEIKPIVFNSDWDGSVKQVKDYLKANLNDWDSYESLEWSELIEANLTTHKYVVRHKYRTSNGYGAKIIINQIFYLDENGTVVNVKDYQ